MIGPQSIRPGPSNARQRAGLRRDPANLEPSSVIVRAVAVSSCRATTVPTRHITRRPNNAAPAMGPHKYGSRGFPKSRACRAASASCPSPIWRSSTNKDGEQEAAQGRRVRAQDLSLSNRNAIHACLFMRSFKGRFVV